ncbi:MAG: nitrate/nitrite transporter [Dehalococcoidia bacterium]
MRANLVSPGANRRAAAITTVALLVVCQSFQGLVVGGVALFLPKIRDDLHLTFTQGGTLSAASTLVYAFMQIPAGYLADRFGPRRLFFIGALGTNFFGLTFGLLSSFPLAVANQACQGFFRSLLFAPGLVLISTWFPPNRRATAMGLYVAGGFSSNIVLNLVGPTLANHFGWRMPFLTFSLFGLAAAVAYIRFAKDAVAPSPARAGVREALSLFRYPVMWILGGIQYVRLAVVLGTAFWLPSLFVDEKGFSLTTSGLLIALGAIVTAPSNFLGGYVSDRLRNPYIVIGVSLGVLSVTTSLFVLTDSLVALAGTMCLNAIFLQLYFGPLFAVPVEFLGAERAGISSGFSNMFANLGGFTFAYTIGALKDATGSFEVGFFALSTACVVALVLTLVLALRREHWANSLKRATSPPRLGTEHAALETGDV